MAKRLDELVKSGVNHVTSFVPWQAVESDIAHTLPRFLQAIHERGMSVSLILTPELAVHYPHSGLPKDLFQSQDTAAVHESGGPVVAALPPNLFALPSLASPEVVKRFHGFLSKVDGMLSDLARSQPRILGSITAVLGGSFWKYYRDPEKATEQAFGGVSGDFSHASQLTFRQRVDQQFSSREFQDPTAASSQRWKSRSYESVNRRWFSQQNEDVFRARASQVLRRKTTGLRVRQAEIFSPEADPSTFLSRMLQMTSGGRADFRKLEAMVREASRRASWADGSIAAPVIHWSKLGPFRSLSGAEKQFLIFQSILLCGSQGGGVLLDEAEWFALSPTFRLRAEALAKQLSQGALRLHSDCFYLVPSLWSGTSPIWTELSSRSGPHGRLAASLDRVGADPEAKLVVVDPSFVLSRETVQRLVAIARAGKVVAIPRSELFTDPARRELESHLSEVRRMEIQMGVSCRFEPLGLGQLVLYDLPVTEGENADSGENIRRMIEGLMNLAQLRPVAQLTDERLKVIALEKRSGGLGVFLFNPTSRKVSGDLYFAGEVVLSDLALMMQEGTENVRPSSEDSGSKPSARFELEVPAFGILPISVDGSGEEAEERRQAAISSTIMKDYAEKAELAELPGYSAQAPGMESVWN